MENDNLVKIFFEWKDEDGTLRSESMWAEGLDRDSFRLDNVPFFMYGISYNDILNTVIKENSFFFNKIIKRGGHSTLRAYFLNKNKDQQERIVENISTLGATIERASEPHVAIDIPSSIKLEPIIDLLKKAESEGVLEYEEGFIYKD